MRQLHTVIGWASKMKHPEKKERTSNMDMICLFTMTIIYDYYHHSEFVCELLSLPSLFKSMIPILRHTQLDDHNFYIEDTYCRWTMKSNPCCIVVAPATPNFTVAFGLRVWGRWTKIKP
jgi:hypothetical protein